MANGNATGLTVKKTQDELDAEKAANPSPLPLGLTSVPDAGLAKAVGLQTPGIVSEQIVGDTPETRALQFKESSTLNENAVKIDEAEKDKKVLEVKAAGEQEIAKKQAQAAGDKTPDIKTADAFGAAVYDDNPNNQTDSEEKRDVSLAEYISNPKNSYADLGVKLLEEQNKERAQINTMRENLFSLADRPVEVDLTPLAGLISDPRRAELLLKTLKPETSNDEVINNIMTLQQKLAEREDKFRRDRISLAADLAKHRDENAAKKLKELHGREVDKDKTIERSHKNWEKVNSKRLESYNSIGSTIGLVRDPDAVDPDGFSANPLIQSIVRFKTIRSVQTGPVTDADIRAVSAMDSILNRAKVALKSGLTGIKMSEEDQFNFAVMMHATAKIEKAILEDSLERAAVQVETGFGKSFGVKPGDLRKEGQWFDKATNISDIPLKEARSYLDTISTAFRGRPASDEEYGDKRNLKIKVLPSGTQPITQTGARAPAPPKPSQEGLNKLEELKKSNPSKYQSLKNKVSK